MIFRIDGRMQNGFRPNSIMKYKKELLYINAFLSEHHNHDRRTLEQILILNRNQQFMENSIWVKNYIVLHILFYFYIFLTMKLDRY